VEGRKGSQREEMWQRIPGRGFSPLKLEHQGKLEALSIRTHFHEEVIDPWKENS
jgi:hypothetical protein